MFRTIIAVPILALAMSQTSQAQMKTATGEFDVKMLPPAPTGNNSDGAGDGFVRLALEKAFRGSLEGTSHVAMMATSDGKNPAGGYVALERFTGKLDGKSGSFIMQHSGIMAPGMMEIRVQVSPGTGTGELAGIEGTLEIRMEGKKHFYTLKYTLASQ
ncbi:hypothetical protein F183_A34890 [Bryobacterales bacterium F-183]|nr:hypothetical protein F183_A34890 [Bryobacterales bacterium F-183]